MNNRNDNSQKNQANPNCSPVLGQKIEHGIPPFKSAVQHYSYLLYPNIYLQGIALTIGPEKQI